MAHEVESMMYAGRTPWHGLGEYVGEENLVSADAIKAAGLDWTVSLDEMYFELRKAEFARVPDFSCVRRSTDSRILGVVGTGYKPIQNAQAFEFLDGLVTEGDVRYHTAGSLRGGQWVWALVQLPGGFDVVKGDSVVPYLFCITSHDGSLALMAFPTNVRVVCANTARMALGDRKGSGIKVRHTTNAEARLQEAQAILRKAHTRFHQFGEFAKELAKVRVPDDEARVFFEQLLPATGPKVSTQIANQRDRLFTLFQEGVGQQMTGVAGTAWALHNAVTEWVNYERTTRNGDPNLGGQDKRFEAAIMGTGNDVVEKAQDLLIGYVG